MIRRLAEEARLSGAVVHANTVYLAGQVADDATLDAEGQTADILRQIDALLKEAGTSKRYLLSVQIFIADLADFPGLNRAWTPGSTHPPNPPAPPSRPGSPTPPGASKSPEPPPSRPSTRPPPNRTRANSPDPQEGKPCAPWSSRPC